LRFHVHSQLCANLSASNLVSSIMFTNMFACKPCCAKDDEVVIDVEKVAVAGMADMEHPVHSEKGIHCNSEASTDDVSTVGDPFVGDFPPEMFQPLAPVKISKSEIIEMKRQFQLKLVELMALARESPLHKVLATDAIEHYSKVTAHKEKQLSKADFKEATASLALQHKIQVDDMYLAKIFNLLDSQGKGYATNAQWASGLPVFFGGGGVDVERAIFKQIDANGDGTLDIVELQEYCCPVIEMIVPLGRDDLKKTLQTRLATQIFEMTNTDQCEGLTPHDFNLWCSENNLCQKAFECLEILSNHNQ